MRGWLHKQKNKPWADCGLTYPYYVMDFDHREGTDKLSDVNTLIRHNAWYKLRLEVAKCDFASAARNKQINNRSMLTREEWDRIASDLLPLQVKAYAIVRLAS